MFIEVGQEGDPCQERFGHVRTIYIGHLYLQENLGFPQL